MTTTVLSRLLIHLRRTECRPPPRTRTSSHYSPSSSSPYSPDDDDYCLPIDYDDYDDDEYDVRRRSRAISPFGLVPLNRGPSGGSAHSATSGGGGGGGDKDGGHARALSADNALEITQIPLAYRYHYQKRTYDPSECTFLDLDR